VNAQKEFAKTEAESYFQGERAPRAARAGLVFLRVVRSLSGKATVAMKSPH
jgi:hypothetical protein